MTAHDHATYTPGCYRCEFSAEEESRAVVPLTALHSPDPGEESTLDVLRRQRQEFDAMPTEIGRLQTDAETSIRYRREATEDRDAARTEVTESRHRIQTQLLEIQRLDRIIVDLNTAVEQYRHLYLAYKKVSDGQAAELDDAHNALDSRVVPRRESWIGERLSLGGRIREWRSLQRAKGRAAVVVAAQRVVACIAADSSEHALRYHVEGRGCLRELSDAVAGLERGPQETAISRDSGGSTK